MVSTSDRIQRRVNIKKTKRRTLGGGNKNARFPIVNLGGITCRIKGIEACRRRMGRSVHCLLQTYKNRLESQKELQLLPFSPETSAVPLQYGEDDLLGMWPIRASTASLVVRQSGFCVWEGTSLSQQSTTRWAKEQRFGKSFQLSSKKSSPAFLLGKPSAGIKSLVPVGYHPPPGSQKIPADERP